MSGMLSHNWVSGLSEINWESLIRGEMIYPHILLVEVGQIDHINLCLARALGVGAAVVSFN